MTEERKNSGKTTAIPFKKEYHKRVVGDFSSTNKLADCLPKGENFFGVILGQVRFFVRITHFQAINIPVTLVRISRQK